MKANRVVQLLAVSCFIALVVVLTFQLTRQDSDPRREKRDVTVDQEKKTMGLDDWLNGRFSYKTFYPKWISDSEYVTASSNQSIQIIDIETENERLLLPSWALKNRSDAFSWSVSSDLEYVAIFYGYVDGYAEYVRTYSVDIWEVSTGEKIFIPDLNPDNIQKYKWSPMGHDFAYVQGFNIYIARNFTAPPHQITSDGHEQLMFNGISDWLHSVEIADDDALMWWSPNDSYFAYAKINQSGVEQFEMTVYNESKYPKTEKFPYPKPGTTIPTTTVHIVDLNINPWPVTHLVPNLDPNWDGFILNSAVWRGHIFTLIWKNRIENEAITEDCAAPSFICMHTDDMTAKSPTGWLGNYKPVNIFPSPNLLEYMTVQSNGGFLHIVVYDGTSLDYRTFGQFEVTDTSSGWDPIHFYDLETDNIYFTSTEVPEQSGQGLPRIRHLWRVKAHGEDRNRECISCSLNVDFENRCNWVNPSFSKNGTFLVINCGGTANGPPVTTLHRKNAIGDYVLVRTVEDNQDLQATLQEYYFREMMFGSLQLPEIEGDWYYELLIPPKFDPNKKYPLLVEVYSGPAYQEVVDRFSVSWKDYVASSKEVVVMSFDGRGTGYRGDDIRHMVYKKLGQYEPLDQIAAAKIIGQEKSYIDASRTAIWGWSFGGYATSRTIGEDQDGVFKCGFAVAPVTNWEFYSTIYTERYMLQPKDNKVGYEKSSTLQNMENFKKHRYSLFHGTRDENVHFQNSAYLSKYLISNNVDFRAFYAADDDHHMGWVPNDYKNIYKMLTRQMDICFRQ